MQDAATSAGEAATAQPISRARASASGLMSRASSEYPAAVSLPAIWLPMMPTPTSPTCLFMNDCSLLAMRWAARSLGAGHACGRL